MFSLLVVCLPSLNNGKNPRTLKTKVALSGNCPQSRYKPSRYLLLHTLHSRCYLKLRWRFLSKLNKHIQSVYEPSSFHLFSSTEVIVIATAMLFVCLVLFCF